MRERRLAERSSAAATLSLVVIVAAAVVAVLFVWQPRNASSSPHAAVPHGASGTVVR